MPCVDEALLQPPFTSDIGDTAYFLRKQGETAARGVLPFCRQYVVRKGPFAYS